MADAIQTIRIQALWDGTQLQAGTTTSEQAVDSLASSVETASTDMRTSLAAVGDAATTEFGSTLPAATDTAAIDLTTKASKFKAVGTELGTQVAQGVASGVDPATSAVNVGTALSGLLAASAATGLGAAAAVGIGLGVALVKGMMDSAKEEAGALRDTVNTLLGGVENDFKGSLSRIIREMRSELGKVEAITRLGDGDLGAGWAELERISLTTGTNIQDLVDYLQGKATPAAQRVADEFGRGRDLVRAGQDIIGDTNQELAANYGVAKNLVDEAEKNTKAWNEAKDAATGLNSLMNGTKSSTAEAADNAARLADNLLRAGRNANFRVDVGI